MTTTSHADLKNRKKLNALDADVEIRSKRGLGYSMEVLK